MQSQRSEGGDLELLPMERKPYSHLVSIKTINQLVIIQQVCVLESLPWEMLCEERIFCQCIWQS